MYDIVEYKRIEESALKIQDERRTEMGILIRGGRIVDAATDTDKTGDIYLEDGIIAEIGQKLKKKDGRPCDRCERKAGHAGNHRPSCPFS